MKKSSLYVLFISLVSVLFFVIRFSDLGHLEPRIDQAYFARWIQDLNRAEYFLLKRSADDTWLGALERDSKSFVHHLGRRIYNGPVHALQVVTLGIYLLPVSFLDDSYRIQVAVGILGSVAVLLVLGCFPFWVSRYQDHVPFGRYAWVGFTSMLIAGSALYLHQFSGWGVHNYGVAFSLVATAFVSRFLTTMNGTGFTAAALATVLAVYTHYTNVLLLPAAMFIALAGNSEWPQELRLAFAIRLLIVLLICALPVVAIGSIVGGVGQSVAYATSASLDTPLISRLEGWFVVGSKLFSWPGVFLGIAGNMIAYRVYAIRIPALILIVHLALWCVMPGFAEKWLRTYLYALPFLSFGVAICLVSSFVQISSGASRYSYSLVAFISAVFIWHLIEQGPGILSGQPVQNRLPTFWAHYLRGQGKLQPMMREIEEIVRDRGKDEGSTLATWSYQIQDLYLTLRSNVDGDTILPPLDSMWSHQQKGRLSTYLARRGHSLSSIAPQFLLASNTTPYLQVHTGLNAVLGETEGNVGAKFSLRELKKWETESGYGTVSLYEVIPRRCRLITQAPADAG